MSKIFLKAYKIKSVLSEYAQMVLKFLRCRMKGKSKQKAYAASKSLPNSEDCSESRIRISVPASFSLIGRFFLCQAGFQNNFQAVFGATFTIIGGKKQLPEEGYQKDFDSQCVPVTYSFIVVNLSFFIFVRTR